MQFTTAILALAATAFAAPNVSARGQCTFGQYACSIDRHSIKQCDISGNWVEIGACPKGDYCDYDSTNKLPYCYGPKKERRGGDGDDAPWCAAPGTYSCSADAAGIDVCNAQNQLVPNGPCPDGTHCELLESAGWQPFCVEN